MKYLLFAYLFSNPAATGSSSWQEFADFKSCKQALDGITLAYMSAYRTPPGFCTPKGMPDPECVTDAPTYGPDGTMLTPGGQRCTQPPLPTLVFAVPQR